MMKTQSCGLKIFFSPYLVVTLEGLEATEPRDGRGIPHPLQRLPVSDDPHILHLVDEIEEHNEACLVVRLGEPRCMVVQSEGCPETYL